MSGLSEAVIICKGELSDPGFSLYLARVKEQLQKLLNADKETFHVVTCERWNSVRVTFHLPTAAAQRLRCLAQRTPRLLLALGIYSVQTHEGRVSVLIDDRHPSVVGTSTDHGETEHHVATTGSVVAAGPQTSQQAYAYPQQSFYQQHLLANSGNDPCSVGSGDSRVESGLGSSRASSDTNGGPHSSGPVQSADANTTEYVRRSVVGLLENQQQQPSHQQFQASHQPTQWSGNQYPPTQPPPSTLASPQMSVKMSKGPSSSGALTRAPLPSQSHNPVSGMQQMLSAAMSTATDSPLLVNLLRSSSPSTSSASTSGCAASTSSYNTAASTHITHTPLPSRPAVSMSVTSSAAYARPPMHPNGAITQQQQQQQQYYPLSNQQPPVPPAGSTVQPMTAISSTASSSSSAIRPSTSTTVPATTTRQPRQRRRAGGTASGTSGRRKNQQALNEPLLPSQFDHMPAPSSLPPALLAAQSHQQRQIPATTVDSGLRNSAVPSEFASGFATHEQLQHSTMDPMHLQQAYAFPSTSSVDGPSSMDSSTAQHPVTSWQPTTSQNPVLSTAQSSSTSSAHHHLLAGTSQRSRGATPSTFDNEDSVDMDEFMRLDDPCGTPGSSTSDGRASSRTIELSEQCQQHIDMSIDAVLSQLGGASNLGVSSNMHATTTRPSPMQRLSNTAGAVSHQVTHPLAQFSSTSFETMAPSGCLEPPPPSTLHPATQDGHAGLMSSSLRETSMNAASTCAQPMLISHSAIQRNHRSSNATQGNCTFIPNSDNRKSPVTSSDNSWTAPTTLASNCAVPNHLLYRTNMDIPLQQREPATSGPTASVATIVPISALAPTLLNGNEHALHGNKPLVNGDVRVGDGSHMLSNCHDAMDDDAAGRQSFDASSNGDYGGAAKLTSANALSTLNAWSSVQMERGRRGQKRGASDYVHDDDDDNNVSTPTAYDERCVSPTIGRPKGDATTAAPSDNALDALSQRPPMSRREQRSEPGSPLGNSGRCRRLSSSSSGIVSGCSPGDQQGGGNMFASYVNSRLQSVPLSPATTAASSAAFVALKRSNDAAFAAECERSTSSSTAATGDARS